jgi:hypothetical protein
MVALVVGGYAAPAVACPTREPEIALVVSVQVEPSEAPQHYYLECLEGEPTDKTTLPTPESACDTAAELGPEFFNATPDPQEPCTKNLGGSDRAWVTGWIHGTLVHAHFSLMGGCEIRRWKTAENILDPSNA